MADGRIIIDTQIDSSGAEKGVGGLNSKLTNVAKVGFKAFTGAVVAAGTAIGALGAIGAKYNSDLEQYMASFETMLGSAEKATTHLNDLKEFAAKTPFELGDLANASKTLLAFGANVNDITPNLKMLGDISLGNKEKFNSLALVFGQVQSQGKLMGQDLLQMINAGFNPLQVISEKTGKSMSQLKEEMSKGQISFEMVADAMKVATSEGGKFYGAMEKQSKTLAGLWSTLKDNFKSLTGEVFIPLSNALKDNVLPTLLGYVDTLSKEFKEKGITGLVGAIGEIVADMISKLSGSLPNLINMGIQIINSLVNGLRSNLPTIVKGAVEAAENLILGFYQMLPNILQMGIDLIVQLAQGLAQAYPKLIPKAIEAILTLVTTLLENIDLIIDAGMQLIMGLADGLINALPILIEKIPIIIDKLLIAFSNNTPRLIEMGVNLILKLAVGLIQAIPELIKAIPKIIFSIIEALVKYYSNLVKVGSELVGKIKSGISDKIDEFKTIGTNIVKGVWEGITSMGSWIGSKVSGFFSGIVNKAKSALGIHSPSRVFRDQIGKYMAQGVGVGFEDETDSLEKSINKNLLGTISSFNIDEASAKMTAAVYQEQTNLSRKMTSGVDRTINHTNNNVTNNNDNGLNIENFYNNRSQDVKALAEELEFYRKQSLIGEGVK